MRINIHASCVAIRGQGVLLLGDSGAGKSDVALRLIDGGARLVADDRCELFVRGGKLHVAVPAAIAGLIELRGIGIVKMPHVKTIPLVLGVRLSRIPTRLPRPGFYAPPPPLAPKSPLPLITVHGREASAPARIRAALAAFSNNGFRETFNQ